MDWIALLVEIRICEKIREKNQPHRYFTLALDTQFMKYVVKYTIWIWYFNLHVPKNSKKKIGLAVALIIIPGRFFGELYLNDFLMRMLSLFILFDHLLHVFKELDLSRKNKTESYSVSKRQKGIQSILVCFLLIFWSISF